MTEISEKIDNEEDIEKEIDSQKGKPQVYTRLNNEEVKGEFLKVIHDKLSENTYKNFSLKMRKISEYEITYKDGRDLYDFTFSEIVEMLKHFRAKTKKSINNYKSIIIKYLDYCVSGGIISNNIDLMESLTSDALEKLLNKVAVENQYITREELLKLLPQMVNWQDRAAFILIFEGVMGKELSDLRNIKIQDIDIDKKSIKLKDREVFLSDEAIRTVQHAMNEIIYHKNNGNVNGQTICDTIELAQTSYLFKISKGWQVGDESVNNTSFRKRFEVIKEALGKKFFTPQKLYTSGMLHALRTKEKEEGRELLLREIQELFSELYGDDRYNTAFKIKDIKNMLDK